MTGPAVRLHSSQSAPRFPVLACLTTWWDKVEHSWGHFFTRFVGAGRRPTTIVWKGFGVRIAKTSQPLSSTKFNTSANGAGCCGSSVAVNVIHVNCFILCTPSERPMQRRPVATPVARRHHRPRPTRKARWVASTTRVAGDVPAAGVAALTTRPWREDGRLWWRGGVIVLLRLLRLLLQKGHASPRRECAIERGVLLSEPCPAFLFGEGDDAGVEAVEAHPDQVAAYVFKRLGPLNRHAPE